MGMPIDDSERYLKLMLGGMKYAVRYWKDKDKEEYVMIATLKRGKF